MTRIETKEEIADLHECVRRGQRPRPGARYRIKVGNDRLEFEHYVIADPVPIGRQVLDASGLRPVKEHLLFLMLDSGIIEEIRLDETVDVFERGVEKFIAFRSDRSFRFILDDRRFEWGSPAILGRVLKALAGVDPAENGVWLERRDEPDLLIGNDQEVDLSGEEIERLRTGPIFILCIEGEDFPWPKSTITMEEIAALGGWDPAKGVIEVDKDQNERQLAPGDVITIKPGLSYGKTFCFKRG